MSGSMDGMTKTASGRKLETMTSTDRKGNPAYEILDEATPATEFGDIPKSTKVIFEDEWCKVSMGALEIKWFYFPTTQSKKIDVHKIKGVYYREQNFRADCFKIKGWGMSLTPCWWGCDALRDCHGKQKDLKYFNVVIDNGEKTYKGFTVQHIGRFLRALRPQLADGTVVKHDLPF